MKVICKVNATQAVENLKARAMSCSPHQHCPKCKVRKG